MNCLNVRFSFCHHHMLLWMSFTILFLELLLCILNHENCFALSFWCIKLLNVPHRDQLPESAYKYQLLGLNLLFLLSQNRVAEFHTELELLPADQIQSNVYIRHPLSLEQYLMEGSYNKVCEAFFQFSFIILWKKCYFFLFPVILLLYFSRNLWIFVFLVYFSV